MPRMPRPMRDDDFDERYYTHGCGRPYARDDVWFAFFARIADGIVSTIGTGRALDAGCAWGLLVEALRDRGVDAYGFDISSYAIAQAAPAIRPYCWQASATDEIDGRYDLIVCQEIFPHLTEEDGHAAIANFCRHGDAVLFSCSPSDPTAPRHRNAKRLEFWLRSFERHGFAVDRAIDASFMTPYAVLLRSRL